MVEKLKNHCNQHFPFLKQKKVLLAVSGGLDSMVLVYLFQQLHYEIGVAHCNFQLRGLESFEDQNFIQNYAKANSIPIFITQFDTQAFAQDYKLSIQVAARELRYNWFYELLETQNFDYVLTAHHADDNLETFLINLSRGTGLDGLTGIPEQNDKVIRPLLAFSRQEIEAYAKQNAIQWREDSSNASDKYLRNKIRHNVVPILKELNTDFIASFQKTQEYLQQAQVMVEDASIMVYQQVAKEVGEEIHFDLKKLKPLPNYKSYLYQWLREFGFSAWDDVYDLVDSQSGKQIFSSHFRLLKNRDYLVLCPLDFTDSKKEYFITKNQKEVKVPLNLSICKVTDISDTTIESIFVDETKLQYPLVLRHWKRR
jgi:tRNA(Ile)-lysidine synthetase-like protein